MEVGASNPSSVSEWLTRLSTSCERDSAAFFASRHDSGVQSLAQPRRHLVDLVGPVDLDGLPRGVQRNLAVQVISQLPLPLARFCA